MVYLITEHESFQDLLAIVQHTSVLNKQAYPSRIIHYLTKSYIRELKDHKRNFKSLTKSTTSRYLGRNNQSQTQIVKLERIIQGLASCKQAICDHLVYTAGVTKQQTTDWRWSVGDQIPKLIEYSPSTAQSTLSNFFVPNVRILFCLHNLEPLLTILKEFLCPISQELLEGEVKFFNPTINLQILTSHAKDPVIAADSFSYERVSIKH